jgi:GxxExxY protein
MESDSTTQRIIGCAFAVHNTLGTGFLEKVYENALAIQLREGGLRVEQQHPIAVFYHGQPVGEFFADLLINDTILVEIKAVRSLAKEHEVQLVNYLAATGLDVGLLIGFGDSVQVKRKYKTYRKSRG